jgi:hypothetical protein
MQVWGMGGSEFNRLRPALIVANPIVENLIMANLIMAKVAAF